MTDNSHSITAPDELVEDLWQETQTVKPERWVRYLFDRAAQWGYEQRGAVNEAELQKARDEELEACCADIHTLYGQYRADWLRSMRRPKPKSQAEKALNALDDAMIGGHIITTSTAAPTIRAALERLRELEGNQ